MLKLPKGFIFSTGQANFRYKERDDLALIYSNKLARCAAVFTKNLFQAAPIIVCKENLEKNNYNVQGVVINSGIANAGTGELGILNCRQSLKLLSSQIGIDPNTIVPASTGVIGEQFDMRCWETGVKELKQNLGKKDIIDVAKAIMTTDTFPKICSRYKDGIAVVGVAKGAGMICPNMATMLCFLMTDVKIEQNIFQGILKDVVDYTFNRITVDGDTSTNDCVIALANGMGGGKVASNQEISDFTDLVYEVLYDLSYKIIQDAEGGTKVVHLKVIGAINGVQAERVARAIATSPLVKTAIYGEDANWGRIVAAIGRSGADIDINKITIKVSDIEIFKNSMGTAPNLDVILLPYLKKQDIFLQVDLGMGGEFKYNILFSDFSEEYVKINGRYRT